MSKAIIPPPVADRETIPCPPPAAVPHVPPGFDWGIDDFSWGRIAASTDDTDCPTTAVLPSSKKGLWTDE